MSATTSLDATAPTRLLAYALDPKARPARHETYSALIEQWLTDPTFARQVADAAAGLGLKVLAADPVLGMVVAADADSVFTPAVREVHKTISGEGAADRLIAGVILAAITAWCYPTARSLNDPGLRQVTAKDVDDMLRDHIRIIDDGHATLDEELEPAWEHYSNTKPVEYTSEGRLRRWCAHAMIGRALEWLRDQGMLIADPGEATLYRTTDRFRHHVALHAGTLAYRAIVDSPANPTDNENV